MPNYWAVGATVQNQDMTDFFIEHGIWYADAQGAQSTISQINVGDRIAIKKMLGQGATDIDIKAVGIVRGIGAYHALPFVVLSIDWLDLRKEGRKVPFGGMGSTIHPVGIPARGGIFQL
jgi:hypothetical protein